MTSERIPSLHECFPETPEPMGIPSGTILKMKRMPIPGPGGGIWNHGLGNLDYFPQVAVMYGHSGNVGEVTFELQTNQVVVRNSGDAIGNLLVTLWYVDPRCREL